MSFFPVINYRVIDGDTIEVRLEIWPPASTQIEASCRLEGVDAPERFTREGKAVKSLLERYLHAKSLECRHIRADKYYGRFVGDIRVVDGPRLSAFLLQHNLALPWPPGTPKPQWTEDDKRRFWGGLKVAMEAK